MNTKMILLFIALVGVSAYFAYSAEAPTVSKEDALLIVNDTKWENVNDVVTQTQLSSNCIIYPDKVNPNEAYCTSVFEITDYNLLKSLAPTNCLSFNQNKTAVSNESITYSTDGLTYSILDKTDLTKTLDTTSPIYVKYSFTKPRWAEAQFEMNWNCKTFQAYSDPVASCGNLTQPGDYTLGGSGTVLNSTGGCIEISNNSINLDCQGALINYSQSGLVDGNGILINGYNNISVRNCILFEGNATLSTKYAILITGHNLTINNNTITTRAAGSEAIYVKGLNNNLVTNNIIANNTISVSATNAKGIHFQRSPNGNRAEDNIINTSGTGGNGISADTTATNLTIQRNTIGTKGTTAQGIYLQSGSNNAMVRNNVVITSSSGVAYQIDSPTNDTYAQYNQFTTLSAGISAISIGTETSGNNYFVNNNFSTNKGAIISDQTSKQIINYIIYNNSFGSISWNLNTQQNLTLNISNNNGFGLGMNIFIGNNTIAINTSAFGLMKGFAGQYNQSANMSLNAIGLSGFITLYGYQDYSTSKAVINNSGYPCRNIWCTNISYIAGNYLFNASFLGSFTFSQNYSNAVANLIVNMTQPANNSIISGNISINWTVAYNTLNYRINISLSNSTQNYVIIDGLPSFMNFTYYNFSNISTGDYNLNITVCDNQSDAICGSSNHNLTILHLFVTTFNIEDFGSEWISINWTTI